MLAGGIAATQLPIEQYPTIAPPAVVIAAQYPGADIAETTCSEVFVDAIFSGIAAEQLLLKGARGKCPGVQRSAADPERLVQSLIRPGAEAVQGDGETLYAKFGHGV